MTALPQKQSTRGTVLAAQGVGVTRNGRRILDAASVRFDQPGLTVVIGPNGAGKSTLLAALAGVSPPTDGAVTLDGQPLAAIPAKALARRRAYLPQSARCEWPISVERLVALGLTPTLPAIGDLTPQDRARIAEVLREFDLTHLRDQAATTLSGGELARAMLGRSVVGDPDIVIADEPVSGLDPRHALEAMERLRALADGGRTIIVALHDLSLAARYADHVLALKQGRVAAYGAVRETLTAPMLKDLFDVNVRVLDGPDGLEIYLGGRA